MKKLGRAFNHLEDLTFFYGSEGARESLTHLKEVNLDASSLRMKWDGGLQIYWGRETVNGPLIFTGHNGWARGAKSTSSEELVDFIMNQSGGVKTADEEKTRELFAYEFANLYNHFNDATPLDFIGFVYGDALFREKQIPENDVYNLYPNKTGYHIEKNTDLGKSMENVDCMIVIHAYFPEFGMKDDQQIPKDDFSDFKHANLLIINPYYNKIPVSIDTCLLENHISEHSVTLDSFLAPMQGVSAFKDYIYKYTNTKAKRKELATLGDDFLEWLNTAKISAIQYQKIQNRIAEHPGTIDIMFKTVKYIMNLKNSIIDQIDNGPTDIKTSNSEGWVRYAGIDKKFGNVKFVPRHRWLP